MCCITDYFQNRKDHPAQIVGGEKCKLWTLNKLVDASMPRGHPVFHTFRLRMAGFWGWPFAKQHVSLSSNANSSLHLCAENGYNIRYLIAQHHDKMLNLNQCRVLSSMLDQTTENVQKLHQSYFRLTSSDALTVALENLYRISEKAHVLVKNCCATWWQAIPFQIQNEEAFREIFLSMGLCYNTLYEIAKASASKEKEFEVDDLRQRRTFLPPAENEVRQDQLLFHEKLQSLVDSNAFPMQQKKCLAKYLLRRLQFISNHSQTGDGDMCMSSSWVESDGPIQWGQGSDFLGAGASGAVHKVMWFDIPCAKKQFKDLEGRKDAEDEFNREACILASLNHPNIVKFLCYKNNCSDSSKRWECFIAMEWMENNLDRVICGRSYGKSGAPFPILVAVDIMLQVAYGMSYLHGVNVAHRDLKPHNVVASEVTGGYLNVKLVDFGLSKTKIKISMSNTISQPNVGTTPYRAPEVFRSGSGRAKWFKADVYSYAVTCSKILTGREPFEGLPRTDIYAAVKSGTRPALPVNCPLELISLVTNCWTSDPGVRPEFLEICMRLEKFKYKLLGGSPQQEIDSSSYIENMLKSRAQTYTRLWIDGDEEIDTDSPASDILLEPIGGISRPSCDPVMNQLAEVSGCIFLFGQRSEPGFMRHYW